MVGRSSNNNHRRGRLARAVLLAWLVLPYTVLSQPITLSQQTLALEADKDGGTFLGSVALDTDVPTRHWSASSDASWLKFYPMQGRGAQTVTVQVSPARLPPGYHQGVVSFRVKGNPGTTATLQVDYHLHAARGVSVHSGNDQAGAVGDLLPAPLIVRVTGPDGKPLPGTMVVFTTVVGEVDPPSFTTTADEAGLARFRPRLMGFGAIGISARSAQLTDQPAYFNAVGTGWISTLAGDGVAAYGGDDGPADLAQLNAPFAMVLRDEALLFVDYFNHVVRAIDLDSATIRRVLGSGAPGFNGDDLPPLKTAFNDPFGIALGRNHALVISDYYNGRIRAVDPQTGLVQTIAGNGDEGYSGDGGPALDASIEVPLDIVADTRGDIYFSDWRNHVVRKLDVREGVISTVAGTGDRDYNGEGIARRAALSAPTGLGIDGQDNLYIADHDNNRIRRVDKHTGKISTVAGNGVAGFSGDGDLAVFAQLDHPYNVFADSSGDLFISDTRNHRIRHVDQASGLITTIAGRGTFGYSGDGELALQASMRGALAVFADNRGTLFISEYLGHRIRRVGPQPPEEHRQESRIARLMRQSRQIFGDLARETVAKQDSSSTARVALGRLLFHDPRLSLDGTVSCSSCHPLDNYGMDGLPVARGIHEREGSFNTPTVLNAALQDSQFWDGRAASVEAQAGEPILNPLEMAMPDEAAAVAVLEALPAYRRHFAQAFPADNEALSFGNITLAIGAFLRTLVTPDAPFDHFISGDPNALSATQLLGLEVFLREGCASCHTGPLLGGQDIRLAGDYPNTPAGDQYEFRKKLGTAHKFKIAPLRNIARTGPYLHDGRYPELAASIEERLAAYRVREGGLVDNVEFSAGELDALTAFLASLTGSLPASLQRSPELPMVQMAAAP